MCNERVTPAQARTVRDQLEQALLALPRQPGRAMDIANIIEEAIDVAIELEFSRGGTIPADGKLILSQARSTGRVQLT